MANLQVEYLGLKLRNPLIIASSGLTAKIENIVAYEQAGAGAIVLKSLFEEQIDNEAEFLNEQSAQYPENMDYLYAYMKQYSVDNYLSLIKEAKSKISIPVIASINCYDAGSWDSFAKDIKEAGADAIEINLYSLPVSKDALSSNLEDQYFSAVRSVAKLGIPVAVKLGQNFTSLVAFANGLKICGAKGAVMFNKYYHPDIDLKKLSLVNATPFSKEGDYLDTLRWTAIVSSSVRELDICASTGIRCADDAIKMLLSGAKTFQICSVLYQKGESVIAEMIDGINEFMCEKGFDKMSEVIGKLNYSNVGDPQKYERVQFMKTFGSK